MPDVVLPCLDEAGALPWVLERMPLGYHPIVADNGSSDGSDRIAAELGAQVVHVPQRGFGAAAYAGLAAAAHPDGIVCFLDADASLDPRQLPLVVDPVAAGDYDLVLGARNASDRAAFSLHQRWGNAEVARRVRRVTGYDVSDIGPMRAARREPLLALGIVDRRFGWPLEMLTRAAAAGWQVHEVEVDYRPRVGRSKVTGTVLGTLRTVRDMDRVLRQSAKQARR